MESMPYTTSPDLPGYLEELAWWVADALDTGNVAGAWDVTRALEELLGEGGDERQPPAPVIGRRFARAHRLLLVASPADADVAPAGPFLRTPPPGVVRTAGAGEAPVS